MFKFQIKQDSSNILSQLTFVNLGCTCDGVDHCSKDCWGFNKLFEDVGFCGQWKAIVQHLLQQLIDHHHIVFDGSFCTHSKIVLRSQTMLSQTES